MAQRLAYTSSGECLLDVTNFEGLLSPTLRCNCSGLDSMLVCDFPTEAAAARGVLDDLFEHRAKRLTGVTRAASRIT